MGFAIDITTAIYEFDYGAYWLEQDSRTVFMGFTADYNFRQGGKVNPFVGMGVGLGLHNAVEDVTDDPNDRTATVMIAPRVGVELWRHLRLTLTANLSCKYYNNLSLTIGYVIGGGKKKD